MDFISFNNFFDLFTFI